MSQADTLAVFYEPPTDQNAKREQRFAFFYVVSFEANVLWQVHVAIHLPLFEMAICEYERRTLERRSEQNNPRR